MNKANKHSIKGKLILINWALAFFIFLSLNPDMSSAISVLVVYSYFALSSLVLLAADKRGLLERFKQLD
jgi:hypothetical protein